MPIQVDYIHKEGEEAALTICPTCEYRVIVNYELHKEHNKEWYCKRCGQRLVLDCNDQEAAHD